LTTTRSEEFKTLRRAEACAQLFGNETRAVAPHRHAPAPRLVARSARCTSCPSLPRHLSPSASFYAPFLRPHPYLNAPRDVDFLHGYPPPVVHPHLPTAAYIHPFPLPPRRTSFDVNPSAPSSLPADPLFSRSPGAAGHVKMRKGRPDLPISSWPGRRGYRRGLLAPPTPALSGGTSPPRLLSSTAPASGITKEAPAEDPRLVVGAVWNTRVLNFNRFIEVSRFPRALTKDVFLDEKVLEVLPGKVKGGRKSTVYIRLYTLQLYIRVIYNWEILDRHSLLDQ